MSHNYLNLKELTFKDDELNEYIQDNLKEYKEDGRLDDEDFVDDIHYYLFNEDYYLIGTHKAKEWLKGHTFDVIQYVKEYEQFNFGECNTDLSNPEKVVNMFAYIRGEELLGDNLKKIGVTQR